MTPKNSSTVVTDLHSILQRAQSDEPLAPLLALGLALAAKAEYEPLRRFCEEEIKSEIQRLAKDKPPARIIKTIWIPGANGIGGPTTSRTERAILEEIKRHYPTVETDQLHLLSIAETESKLADMDAYEKRGTGISINGSVWDTGDFIPQHRGTPVFIITPSWEMRKFLTLMRREFVKHLMALSALMPHGEPEEAEAMKTITILMLSSSPTDQDSLRLGKEQKVILQSLESASNRSRFRVVACPAATIDDLRRYLLEHSPTVVHFSGHGGGDTGLCFEDENGLTHSVDAARLAKLFKLVSSNVKCVVLNACLSKVQAEAICEHIDFVVGMNDEIGDHAAIKFTQGFYEAVWAGQSYSNAFHFGCIAIDTADIPEEHIPVMLQNQRIGKA